MTATRPRRGTPGLLRRGTPGLLRRGTPGLLRRGTPGLLRRGERGSITPLVPIVVLAFFMLGGLVVDGSRELNARGEAQAYAEEAARAGATSVDLTSSTLALDDDTARQRVADYCATVMASNDAVVVCRLDPGEPFTDAETCGGQHADIVVNTQVTLQVSTSLLDIVGISQLSASGAAKARPYEGVTSADAC